MIARVHANTLHVIGNSLYGALERTLEGEAGQLLSIRRRRHHRRQLDQLANVRHQGRKPAAPAQIVKIPGDEVAFRGMKQLLKLGDDRVSIKALFSQIKGPQDQNTLRIAQGP